MPDWFVADGNRFARAGETYRPGFGSPVHAPGWGTLGETHGVAPQTPSFDARAVPSLGSRCAHCAVRSLAPCGAIEGAAGLAELERSHAPLRRVAADGAVFEQGAASDRSFTIVSGWVALTHLPADGRLCILRFALPGDVLPFDRRSPVNPCGAVAVGDVIVCAFTRPHQARLEASHRAFDVRYRAAQAGALEDAYETLSSVLGHSAMERVSRLFLQLSWRSLRRRPRRGDRIYAPLRQIQIGLATGLTAVHVSRVLRRLREDGVAALEDQQLSIFDPAALERRAGVQQADLAVQA